MNEQQRVFLVQARSDYAMFDRLRRQSGPRCHPLHYLQMATEKLAKAFFWRSGAPATSHAMFARFLRAVRTNDRVRHSLGYDARASWSALLSQVLPIAWEVERLAPDLASGGPNPEYPWPVKLPSFAPVEHDFGVWRDLYDRAAGRALVGLLRALFRHANDYL